jgi:hypothetical protein
MLAATLSFLRKFCRNLLDLQRPQFEQPARKRMMAEPEETSALTRPAAAVPEAIVEPAVEMCSKSIP